MSEFSPQCQRQVVAKPSRGTAAIAVFGSRTPTCSCTGVCCPSFCDSRQRSVSRRSSFLLERDKAGTIIDSKEAQVRDSWYSTAGGTGVSTVDFDKFTGTFAYDGLQQDANQQE